MVIDLFVIFTLQVLYVAINTMRWMILIRGLRLVAAVISFFEIILYVVALGMVVTKLDDPVRVVVYALGYAVGAGAGSWVEEQLALGFTIFHIITRPGTDLVSRLRAAGLGVTVWEAQGREGERCVLMAVARRRWASQVVKVVEAAAPDAFVVRTEPQWLKGGFQLRYMNTTRWPEL